MIAIIRGLGAALVVGVGLSVLQPSDELRARVQRCWSLFQSSGMSETCSHTAADSFAPAVLPGLWSKLTEHEKDVFRRALAARLRRDVKAMRGSLTLIDERSEGSRSTLRYRIEEREVELIFDSERLFDVRWRGGSARRHYRRIAEQLTQRYSFEYLLGELRGDGVVVVEDFGNRFLRAEDRGENVMLYKEARWDSKAYPYVSWRWRIRAVPAGADARVEELADSAAGLYLTYRRKLGLVPETVKFIWSRRLRRGSAFRRPGVGMPWSVVAGSGDADETTWHRVVYKTDDVYQRTFEGDPGSRPLGVAVLSDANNTDSSAFADYDDIVVLSEAVTVDQVREILSLER